MPGKTFGAPYAGLSLSERKEGMRSGWLPGESMDETGYIAKLRDEGFKHNPSFRPIKGIMRGDPGFRYGLQEQLSLVKDTFNKASIPGMSPQGIGHRQIQRNMAAVQEMVKGLRSREVSFGLRVLESPHTYRGVRLPIMQMSVGGKVMEIPLQFAGGLVTKGSPGSGAGIWAARQYHTAAGDLTTFQEFFTQRVLKGVRQGPPGSYVGQGRAELAREVQSAIKSTMGVAKEQLGLIESVTFAGYPQYSITETRGRQVAFSPQHEVSGLAAEVASAQKRMLTRGVSTSPVAAMREYDLAVQTYLNRLGDLGYGTTAVKPEHLALGGEHPRAVGSLPSAITGQAWYPASSWAPLRKGLHQLAKRRNLGDPSIANEIRKAGFGRAFGEGKFTTKPWLTPKGQPSSRVYDLPIRLGVVMDPRLGELIVGDSGAIFGSQRMGTIAAMFPETHVSTMRFPIHWKDFARGTAEIQGLEVGSPLYRQIKKAGGWDTLSQGEMSWRPGSPLKLRGGTKREWIGKKGSKINRWVKDILGYSKGQTGFGEITSGGPLTMPEGPGWELSEIRRQAGEGGNLQFVWERGRGKTVNVGAQAYTLAGTRRFAPGRFLDLLLKRGGKPLDVLMRAEEVFAHTQTAHVTLASHWLGLARRNLGEEYVPRVAELLGLDAPSGTRAGVTSATYFAGDDWRITASRQAGVEKYFRGQSGGATLAKHMYGIPSALDTGSGTPFAKAIEDSPYPQSVKREILNRAQMGSAVRLFHDVPISMRRGVGTGLKNRQGMAMRLDDAMYTLQRLGLDANVDPHLRKHANSIMRGLYKSNRPAWIQARQLSAPMLEEGFLDISRKQGMRSLEYTPAAYTKMFYKELPRLVGGVSAENLAGTVLGRENLGVVVTMPTDLHYLATTKKEMRQGFTGKFVSTRQFFIPSPDALGFGKDTEGLFYGDKKNLARVYGDLDVAMRGGNVQEIEHNMNRLQLLVRERFWGKEGMLNPNFRPEFSQYSRLQLAYTGEKEALSIGFTKRKIMAAAPTRERGLELIKMAQRGELTAAVGVQPRHGAMHYIPAAKVRLIRMGEIARGLISKVARFDASDVAYVGQAIITAGNRDQDLDTIFSWINMNAKSQPGLRKILGQEVAYFAQIQRISKEVGGPSMGNWGANLKAMMGAAELGKTMPDVAAEAFAGALKDKSAIALPEVFFRTRSDLARNVALSKLGGAAGGSAKARLAAVGAADLGKSNITMKHYQSVEAITAMIRQKFIGKAKSAGLGLNVLEDVLSFGRGGMDKSKLVESITGFFGEVTAEGSGSIKMNLSRMPEVAAMLESGDKQKISRAFKTIAQHAADVFEVSEPYATRMGVDPYYAGFQGIDPDKPMAKVARLLRGTAIDLEEKGITDYEKIARIYKHLGMNEQAAKALEADNAAKLAGERATAIGEFGTALKNAFKNVWAGETWMGKYGGRAAIIAGGAIVGKGLYDTLSGPDEIMPPPQTPPMPMVGRGIGSVPPTRAFQGPSIQIQKPSMYMQSQFEGGIPSGPGYSAYQDNMMGELGSGMPMQIGGGYDRMGMTQGEAQRFMRDRARSSF